MIPSFATAVLLASGKWKKDPFGRSDPPRVIDYRGPPDLPITASWVLSAAGSPDYRQNGELQNKIVLIGGTHSATGDWHRTPFGQMAGVEVWAQVIETELAGGGAVLPNQISVGLLQFAIGLGLVLLFGAKLKLEKTLGIAIVLLLVAALVVSRIAFGSFRFWVYFVPILGLMLIQQLYDVAKHERDLRMLSGGSDPSATPPSRDEKPVGQGSSQATTV